MAKSFNQDLYRHVRASVKGYCQHSSLPEILLDCLFDHVATAEVTQRQMAYVMIVTI
jgi:hypothetical protein